MVPYSLMGEKPKEISIKCPVPLETESKYQRYDETSFSEWNGENWACGDEIIKPEEILL